MRFANEFGYCELNPFPGCNQIVVSNHGVIFEQHRGVGNGHKNHHLRVDRAKALGYDLMLCTVRSNNKPEKAILKAAHWVKVFEFRNSESGHDIEIWVKTLANNEEYK